MGFIMLGLLKASNFNSQSRLQRCQLLMCRVLCLCGLVLLTVTASAADEFKVQIKQAEVSLHDDLYVLNAELSYPLSPAAKEALLKGIALSWNIPIRILRQRTYLWDEELFKLNLHYQIRYYALLNIYRVKAEHSQQVTNFASLAAALNSIATLRAIPLIDKQRLPAEGDYQVALRIIFDRNALPIPLRPITYFDSQWYLSSEWFVCSLTK